MLGLTINLIISIIFIIPLIRRDTVLDVFVVWGMYFTSNVLCFINESSNLPGFSKLQDYEDSSFIIYGVLVFYALTPLYTIRRNNCRPKSEYYTFNYKEKKVINFIILGGLFSVLYALPFAIKSVLLGAMEIRSVVLNDEKLTVLPLTFWTTIAVAFATFFSIYIGIFYLSIKSNLKKWKMVLLFIATLSYLIVSLCFAARDGLLFYILLSGLFVLNYWKSFNKKIKKTITRLGMIVSVIIIYFLVSFTNDRFSDSDVGVTGYIATQPFVFAENVLQRSMYENNFYGTSVRFPLVNIITGQEVIDFSRDKAYEFTFGTFLTDFYSINGYFSLILLTVIFTEFFKYHLRKSKNNIMKFTLVYSFYMHFIISGFFYFRLGSFSGNVFIFCIVALILLQSNKKTIS